MGTLLYEVGFNFSLAFLLPFLLLAFLIFYPRIYTRLYAGSKKAGRFRPNP